MHRLWPNEYLPGDLAQTLPSPAHFKQASPLVTSRNPEERGLTARHRTMREPRHGKTGYACRETSVAANLAALRHLPRAVMPADAIP